LASAPLSADEVADLRLGAAEGAVMYLRRASWALHAEPVLEAFDEFLADPAAQAVQSSITAAPI
jgi:hypothetical protein